MLSKMQIGSRERLIAMWQTLKVTAKRKKSCFIQRVSKIINPRYAIFMAITKWRYCLQGVHFNVLTDHKKDKRER